MRKRAEISPLSPTSPLLWFAVLGAPAAWGVQFAVGYWITQAQCSPAGERWGIAVEAWAIGIGVVAAATAAAAGLMSLNLFRRTREASDTSAPPIGRIHFLAQIGLAVSPLFLCLIVMTAAGTVALFPCNQS